MRWHKTLWGVRFKGSMKDDKPMLLGFAWHALASGRAYYTDEPTRALLFRTREAARAWCREQLEKNSTRSDCCAFWQFRPVRVVETVTLK